MDNNTNKNELNMTIGDSSQTKKINVYVEMGLLITALHYLNCSLQSLILFKMGNQSKLVIDLFLDSIKSDGTTD